MPSPSATVERELRLATAFFESHPDTSSCAVIGLDEVGRGALAGPVAVGAFALRCERGEGAVPTPAELPSGLKDSKLLSPKRREALFAELAGEGSSISFPLGPISQCGSEGCPAAVGTARATEIDEHGISRALTLAAVRALEATYDALDVPLAGVILDGNLDYLTRGLSAPLGCPLEVVIKADQTCASVAAASVLAKVARDRHMIELDAEVPGYGWAGNKGYGSKAHREAIVRLGIHAEHRASWNLVPAEQQALDLPL
ncbi:ribonuclease HII [Dermabacter sp. p3-SID358]|uniref:ribonuclease HII n=1 Tax=Dermabacter sp. p3-SID358 TaxID=2916114 RepID=UPI0021A375D6|nr:ribonuclease HII [Dermabacter sp. p3-SID358]MCT1866222.1 ribonuclease HII [Dermabacter sp. p3-SID358]